MNCGSFDPKGDALSTAASGLLSLVAEEEEVREKAGSSLDTGAGLSKIDVELTTGSVDACVGSVSKVVGKLKGLSDEAGGD